MPPAPHRIAPEETARLKKGKRPLIFLFSFLAAWWVGTEMTIGIRSVWQQAFAALANPCIFVPILVRSQHG